MRFRFLEGCLRACLLAILVSVALLVPASASDLSPEIEALLSSDTVPESIRRFRDFDLLMGEVTRFYRSRDFAPVWITEGRLSQQAVAILGAPNTFIIGALAASIGMIIGIVLGFSAGFLGGWVDDVVRLVSDVTITIPALLVLIVLQSVLSRITIATMAILIAASLASAPEFEKKTPSRPETRHSSSASSC